MSTYVLVIIEADDEAADPNDSTGLLEAAHSELMGGLMGWNIKAGPIMVDELTAETYASLH